MANLGYAGWHYWNFNGFGMPADYWPNARQKHLLYNRYSRLKETVTKKPDWANEYYDIFSSNMQPLLVYIAGTPVHTDKTHTFYSGENINKRIAWVWDGPGTKNLSARWKMGAKQGQVKIKLNAGDVKYSPIKIKAPEVAKKKTTKLEINVFDENGKEVATDSMKLQIYPKIKVFSPPALAIFDPENQTAPLLDKLGVKYKLITTKAESSEYKTLIIGRKAVKSGSLPFDLAMLDAGLKVIILEQMPGMWESFGFRMDEVMPRVYFPRSGDAVTSGLTADDFSHWRGTPDLLPEYKYHRNYDFRRAPKSSNRHTLASTIFQIPEIVGFKPLAVGGFDLNYSPLLKFRFGKGAIYFSSLDFQQRLGEDPAATLIFNNTLKAAGKKLDPTRKVYFDGDKKTLALLKKIGLEPDNFKQNIDTNKSLLIIGRGSKTSKTAIERFAQGGGNIFFMPQSEEYLRQFGLAVTKKDIIRSTAPKTKVPTALKGIGSGLLRWRESIPTLAFSGSSKLRGDFFCSNTLFVARKGRGMMVFCQMDPFYFADKHQKDGAQKKNISLSIQRQRQMYAQILTNLGAQPAVKVAEKVCTPLLVRKANSIASWNYLGPIWRGGGSTSNIDKKLPGLESALKNDLNVNITYRAYDGRSLDWRKTISANDDAYTDISKALQTGNKAFSTILVSEFNSSEACRALFTLGVNYYAKVYINGKLAFKINRNHGEPFKNQFQFIAPLKKATNYISVVLSSGKTSGGIWCSWIPEGQQVSAGKTNSKLSFYPALDKSWDPYEYFYW